MAKKKGASRTKRKATKKRAGVRSKAPVKRVARAAAGPTDVAPATAARIEANNREHRAIERAIESARERTFSAYRAQFRRFAARREGAAKTIFAEGDSWFNYPLGRAVISQLQGLINTPIANFAWPGAETRQLLALHERQEIEKQFRGGPEPGKKWDGAAFLRWWR